MHGEQSFSEGTLLGESRSLQALKVSKRRRRRRRRKAPGEGEKEGLDTR